MLKPKSDQAKKAAKHFRFHTDTGVSGIVEANSFEEAQGLMSRISLDPIHEKKGFSFDDVDVKYPQITVVKLCAQKNILTNK